MEAVCDTRATEPAIAIDAPVPFPCPANFSLSFLDLPFEIRLKIYRLLFHCSFPLRPVILTEEEEDDEDDEDPQIQLYEYNGYDPYDVPIPGPSKPGVPVDFLLTNQQIHDEASAVLWGTNQVLLQFPLNYAKKWTEVQIGHELSGRSYIFDHGIMPTSYQLQQIRDLVLEICVVRSQDQPLSVPAHLTADVTSEISTLVQTLRGNHRLQSLEIRFTNMKSCYSPARYQTRFYPPVHGQLPPGKVGDPYPAQWYPKCCGWSERDVFGEQIVRMGQIQGLCRRAMRVDGRVLAPFGELRGIKNVEVVGRVEEAWGKWLRGAMVLGEGIEVKPYVEVEVGLDGLPIVQEEALGII